MSKKRRTKTLEKAARTVRDSDEFVEHVFGIARGFAAHHELDAGAGIRGVRQAIRLFDKHAATLAAWFESADRPGSPEHEALNAMGRSAQPLGDIAAVRSGLERAALAAQAAQARLQGKKLQNAPRFAADALI